MRQDVLRGHEDVLERDLSLVDGPQGQLGLHGGARVALRLLGDHEPVDGAVLVAACPHHGDPAHGSVADPLLGAVEDVSALHRGGLALEPDGVGAVGRLGQRERTEELASGHVRQPALLLLVAATQGDRAHGQPALDTGHRGDGAVAARELHGHQTSGHLGHGGHAGHVHAVAEQVELAHAAHEVEVVLAAVPVLGDDGQDVLLHEGPGPQLVRAVLLRDVLEDPGLVRGQGLVQVVVRLQGARGEVLRVADGDAGGLRAVLAHGDSSVLLESATAGRRRTGRPGRARRRRNGPGTG